MRVETSRGVVETDHLTSEVIAGLLSAVCNLAWSVEEGCAESLADPRCLERLNQEVLMPAGLRPIQPDYLEDEE